MNDFAFTSQLQDLPLASRAQQAGDGVERWLTALREADDAEMIAKGMALASDSRGQRLLRSVFGNSHYLSQCAVRDPIFALDVFANGPDAGFAVAMDGMLALQGSEIDFTKLARELRRAKLRAALAVSIGDITGI